MLITRASIAALGLPGIEKTSARLPVADFSSLALDTVKVPLPRSVPTAWTIAASTAWRTPTPQVYVRGVVLAHLLVGERTDLGVERDLLRTTRGDELVEFESGSLERLPLDCRHIVDRVHLAALSRRARG